MDEELDLYEVLGITKDAGKAEVKKAYHKAALSSHPDKVPESERPEAEIKFKAVSQAYEILADDDKRHLYDTHGMSAFDPGSRGAGAQDVDLDDVLQQMFGMGTGGGMPGGSFAFSAGGPGRQQPRRGRDEEQEYEVTLEELYKGKTTRFASTKNVVCNTCSGSGGKPGTKPKECSTCHGKGITVGLRSLGGGMLAQESSTCGNCKGSGKVFKDKDKCKKCKGNRTVEKHKFLELYIPPGSIQGEKVILRGEADQLPDQEPGDIVFHLVEKPHDTFQRAGHDLAAEIKISLVEALTGFKRIVLTHLDGRGLQLDTSGKVLRPNQVLKVAGEGMPIKRSDAKGDLFLQVHVEFPPAGWLQEAGSQKLKELLPKSDAAISADTVDEVDFDTQGSMDDFGAGSTDARAGAEWEDEEEEEDGVHAQCAQQ